MVQKSKTEVRGRPRSFDADKALDRALKVFWRKGYVGASLSDLTKAMGINRSSLYAAFGDKAALFRKALERYEEGPSAFLHDALTEPTAYRMAERLLLGTAATVCGGNGNPGGCMLVQGALAAGNAAEPLRRELAAHRQAAVTAIVCAAQRKKETCRRMPIPPRLRVIS
jgi:AcrR family transcriptional regulator